MDIKTEAQKRIRSTVQESIENGSNMVVNALPGLGKTRGVADLVSELDRPITYVTSRRELYQQFEKMVKEQAEQSISVKRLPAFQKSCPTMAGDHGGESQKKVQTLYQRGVSAREIHTYNQNLPCQEDGSCPSTEAWKFDPDDFDLLVGNYRHLNADQKVVCSEEDKQTFANRKRVVIVDEFPEDAYERKVEELSSVNEFLQQYDELPFRYWVELFEWRHSEEKQEQAADFLTSEFGVPLFLEQYDFSPQRTPQKVVETSEGHVYGAYTMTAILFGEALGNEFLRWEGKENQIALFDKEQHASYFYSPPDLTGAKAVIGLDGTAVKQMWDTAFQTEFDVQQTLSDEERTEYLDEREIRFFQTSSHIKPYSSGQHVNLSADRTVIEDIEQSYATEEISPVIISSKKALKRFKDHGLLDGLTEDDQGYYGDLKGINDFSGRKVGLILGSPHVGDSYVKAWGAYANECVEWNGETGTLRSYGVFGDQIFKHMRENNVFQAAMRVGRGDCGANLFVHTSAYPEWLPVKDLSARYESKGNSKLKVLQAVQEIAKERGEFTSNDVEQRVDYSQRNVQSKLKDLCENDILERDESTAPYAYTVQNENILQKLTSATLPAAS